MSWPRRAVFLRKVYRHHQLRFAVNASFIVGFLSLAVASMPANGTLQPTAPAGTWTAEGAYESLWLGGLALGWLTRWLLLASIDLANPAIGSVYAIHSFTDTTSRPLKSARSASVADPLGKQRVRLTRVARLLVQAARRQEVSAPLHPIASILRGITLQMQRNLSRIDSLKPTPSDALTVMLKTVPTLFAGPHSMDSYQRIAGSADAFDVQGYPLPELRFATKGRWVAFTNHILELLETYARLLAAIWGVFLLVASIYLLTTGKLSLNNI